MAKKKELSFEELLAGADEIVDTLEGGEAGLEESLKIYEKGIENLRKCAELLKGAEQKVQLLKEKVVGAFELEDFEADFEEDEE